MLEVLLELEVVLVLLELVVDVTAEVLINFFSSFFRDNNMLFVCSYHRLCLFDFSWKFTQN